MYLLETNRNVSRLEEGKRALWRPKKSLLSIICLWHDTLFSSFRPASLLLWFWWETECVCSLAPRHDMRSSGTQRDWTSHQIPGRRTNWPDLDLLSHGSSQLWSKAGSHGANIAARSQPSFLLSPEHPCPLQIGFLKIIPSFVVFLIPATLEIN